VPDFALVILQPSPASGARGVGSWTSVDVSSKSHSTDEGYVKH